MPKVFRLPTARPATTPAASPTAMSRVCPKATPTATLTAMPTALSTAAPFGYARDLGPQGRSRPRPPASWEKITTASFSESGRPHEE
eukprot:8280484-Pyramimonas_sp.AAC.1